MNFTFPFGVHIAIVEVDEESGAVELVRYVAVDDCGNQINPLIVEGQVHGGVVQGVAEALWEEAVYDDAGNLRTASLTDYLVPSGPTFPQHPNRHHRAHSQPVDAMGVKGVGEAGTIGSAPAVINAICDALAHRHRHASPCPRRLPACGPRSRRRAPAEGHRSPFHVGSEECPMIPAVFEYVRARLSSTPRSPRSDRAWRRRQAPRRWDVAHPAHEAAARDADGDRRCRATPGPLVRARRR